MSEINPPGTVAAELVGLLEELRLADYNIGAGQHIAAHDLILALCARGAMPTRIEGLKGLLGPLLCNTPRQQEEFDARFAAWAEGVKARIPDLFPDDDDVEEVDDSFESDLETAARRLSVNRRVLRAAAAVAVAGFAAFVAFGESGEHDPVDDDPIVETGPPTPAREGGSGLRTVADDVVASVTGAGTTVAQGVVRHAPEYSLPGSALLALVLAAVAARWYLSRRAAAEFLSARLTTETPSMARLMTQGVELGPFAPKALFAVAQRFRLHRRLETQSLDPEATVHRSIEAGGTYSPVRRDRMAVPEYLIIVDRAHARDHQARMVDRLLDWLTVQGVYVDRYVFDGDPRRCHKLVLGGEVLSTAVTIEQLVARYSRHRLVLVSDGACLFNPYSGRLESWARRFGAWDRRAVLTPEVPENWGSPEARLREAGWRVHPVTEEGLRSLSLSGTDRPSWTGPSSDPLRMPLPPMIESDPRKWLERQAPSDEEIQELLIDLRLYLGDDGMRWLSACAVYPEIHWNLTVRLGQAVGLQSGSSVLTEHNLAALVRLPWFREGRMPEWLRGILLERLDDAERREVHRVVSAVLETAVEGAHSGETLEIAVRQQQRDLGRWISRALRDREPEDSPLREHVFATFMSDPLAFRAPKALRTLLRSRLGGALLSDEFVRLRRHVRVELGLLWLTVAVAWLLMPQDTNGEIVGGSTVIMISLTIPLYALSRALDDDRLGRAALGIGGFAAISSAVAAAVQEAVAPMVVGLALLVLTPLLVWAAPRPDDRPASVVSLAAGRAARGLQAVVAGMLLVSGPVLLVLSSDPSWLPGDGPVFGLLWVLLAPIVPTVLVSAMALAALGRVGRYPPARRFGVVVLLGIPGVMVLIPGWVLWYTLLVAAAFWGLSTPMRVDGPERARRRWWQMGERARATWTWLRAELWPDLRASAVWAVRPALVVAAVEGALRVVGGPGSLGAPAGADPADFWATAVGGLACFVALATGLARAGRASRRLPSGHVLAAAVGAAWALAWLQMPVAFVDLLLSELPRAWNWVDPVRAASLSVLQRGWWAPYLCAGAAVAVGYRAGIERESLRRFPFVAAGGVAGVLLLGLFGLSALAAFDLDVSPPETFAMWEGMSVHALPFPGVVAHLVLGGIAAWAVHVWVPRVPMSTVAQPDAARGPRALALAAVLQLVVGAGFFRLRRGRRRRWLYLGAWSLALAGFLMVVPDLDYRRLGVDVIDDEQAAVLSFSGMLIHLIGVVDLVVTSALGARAGRGTDG